MTLEFIETGNQHLDGNRECNWKQPRYDFKTVFYDRNSFDNYDGIAIKLTPNVVLVDFDYFPEIGEQILKMYPTFHVITSRGLHLYYQKPKRDDLRIPVKSNVLTNSGALVDYKTGSKTMGTIKTDGSLRECSELPESWDELPEMPPLLWPHRYRNAKDMALTGMADGDGRNDALFTHLTGIKDEYDMNQIEYERIAEFINQHVFADELPKKELEATFQSVMSRESEEGDQLESLNPKGNPEGTWKELIRRLNIKVYNNKLYFEKDKKWSSDINLLMREVFDHVYLTRAQRKEFEEQAKILAPRVDGEHFHVQFRNEYMIKNSPEVISMNGGFTPYNVPVDYDPKAYDEHVDKFLDFVTCGDKEIRANVEEMLGHILWTQGFSHKVFFLVNSQGKNGKSTFLHMVNEWIKEPVSSLSLDSFDDATSLATLDGKLVNLGDDIDPIYMEKSKNFKTLASGDTITLRPIYDQPFTLTNRATLIFTANRMPTFRDKTGGMERRIQVIPFNAHVKEVDPYINDRLTTDNAKSYLLNLALNGLKRLQSNAGNLSYSEEIHKTTEEYFNRSDSFRSFTSEFDITGNDGDRVYKMYELYCDSEGFSKPVSKRTFVDKARDMGLVLKKQFKEVKGEMLIVTEYIKKED